ncbi:MAG: class I SAM-dependent methyltransferase [Pseudomonadota bacterium]
MSEFERWQTRFSAPGYLFGKEPNAFVKRNADLIKSKAGGKALSIADGEGRNGVFIAQCGLDVLSLDFSPTAQEKARQLAAERGVTIRTEIADLPTWTWPVEAFDLIAGIFFQFLTPDLRSKVFANVKTALKPDGILLLEGYGPKQLEYKTGGPSQIENLYTPKMLRDAFGDLSELDIKEYDAEVDEGAGHIGMSALVDLVGRK